MQHPVRVGEIRIPGRETERGGLVRTGESGGEFGVGRVPLVEAGLVERERLQSLLVPFAAAEDMEAIEVSRLVNSPRNDSRDCILPA